MWVLWGDMTLPGHWLGVFLEDLGEPLGAPMVPVPPRWLNFARHQVEVTSSARFTSNSMRNQTLTHHPHGSPRIACETKLWVAPFAANAIHMRAGWLIPPA